MMKQVWMILLLVTGLFASDIVWENDLDTAFEKAAKEGKTVMLMVESSHCRWCRKMKYRTLKDPRVRKRLQFYIPVKVMQEDDDAVNSLPEIHGVPTIFFMTADKKVLETVVGYFNAGDFLSYLDDVEKKVPLKKKSEPLTLKWHDTIEDAFKAAKEEHKKVMVLVEDEQCRWCRKMKAGALSDSRVKEKLSKYILLKIDRADQSDMEALPGLRGPIPSFHLMSADKRPLDKLAGYYDTADFLAYLAELAEEY